MSNFHSLTIAEVIPDNNAVIWGLEVPDELKEAYRFESGQHLTFRCMHEGEELRRSYSICSSADDALIKVLIKSVEGGRFSQSAKNNYQAGDVIDVMPPSGHFSLHPEEGKTYVGFAAGSGITPIMGMIYAAMEQTQSARFILFYGNSTSQDILLHSQIAALKDHYHERLSVHYLMSRQKVDLDVYQGRIDQDKVMFFLKNVLQNIEISDYFVCGPGEMIDSVCATLIDSGIDSQRVHNERFLSDGQEIRPSQKRVKQDAGVTITLDGANARCDIKAGETVTLLESAQQAGIDLPYSCKAGVCATCRCRLLEGEVEMINNYSLEQWELDAGYILSCQSVAKSSKIHISFDE